MARTEPKQQRSTDTRNKLLIAGYEVIREVGRDSITTQLVAERAGKSIGTFYRYYESKNALLDALYPNRLEGLGELAKDADVVIYDGSDR